MKNLLAIVFADAHVADRIWAHRPITGDAFYSVEQILDLAQGYRCPWVIGCGDLLDSRTNRSSPIQFWNRMLDRFEQAGVRFGFLQGNHEYDDPPWLSHRHATHLHERSLTIGGIRFYGLDFLPSGRLQEALDAIQPGTQVLLAHQAWAEMCRPGSAWQGQFADIPVVSMMFTGDLHEHRRVDTRGKDRQPLTVYSPGSTVMTSIDNDPHKFVYLLYDDLSVESQPLKTRPVLESSQIVHPEDLDAFLEEIPDRLRSAAEAAARDGLPEALQKPILRVHYSWQLEDACARIQAATKGLCWLFLDESVPHLAPGEASEEDWETLEQALQESCDEEDLVAAGLQLLACPDRSEKGIQAAIEELVAQRLHAAKSQSCAGAVECITSPPTETNE